MVKRGPPVSGLKHQKEKRSMDYFAGLDVSVKETSVCIVDVTGKIVREVKVASEPEALLAVLKNPTYHFKRLGTQGVVCCGMRIISISVRMATRACWSRKGQAAISIRASGS